MTQISNHTQLFLFIHRGDVCCCSKGKGKKRETRVCLAFLGSTCLFSYPTSSPFFSSFHLFSSSPSLLFFRFLFSVHHFTHSFIVHSFSSFIFTPFLHLASYLNTYLFLPLVSPALLTHHDTILSLSNFTHCSHYSALIAHISNTSKNKNKHKHETSNNKLIIYHLSSA